MRILTIFFLFLIFTVLLNADPLESGIPSTEKPKEFQDIGITENLGSTLDLNLQVTDESGQSVPLKKFFNGHTPVIFSLVYFSCPGLCNLHLNGLIEALKGLEWSAGQKFELVAMSFDARETSDLSAKKKANYLKVYSRPGTENGMHFVTASQEVIDKVAQTIGFKYKWNAQANDWAHASAAAFLSPQGKISRYLHGVMFDAQSLKLALIDALNGKQVSFADRLVWYCYQYDGHKQYSLIVYRVLQFAGGFFVILMALFLFPFWLRARREKPS